MAQNGYEVFAMDQRGFGHSQGTKGYIESPELARDDILTFTQKIQEQFGEPELPLFSVGHSLGGAIQLVCAAE